MAIRTVDAEWRGNLAQGSDRMRLGSGALEGSDEFRSRLDQGNGTSPEELLGAAHAGYFSMALQLPMRASLSNTAIQQRMPISELPSFTSYVRRRHPSASQAPL